MHIISSYKVKIKDFNHCFDETIRVYQEAVSFFMDVCQKEQKSFQGLSNNKTVSLMEKLTLVTKKHPTVKYDFNARFYKMPCYLRRAAIARLSEPTLHGFQIMRTGRIILMEKNLSFSSIET